MKESTEKKVISVFLVGLMLFSGLSVLASAVDNGQAVTASQETVTVPASVSAHAAALKENVWLNKIDPSLRDGASAGSKDMIKVTILTKNMGAVNPILSKYMSWNMEGKKVSPSLRTDAVSNVPVTRTVTVPYSALKEIASVPDVMGVYKFTPSVPADINNRVLSEAQQGVEQMKAEGNVPPVPMDYTTPVEHKADAAWSMGYSGSGVNVAVVDTGVDFANPDLVGQWAVDNNTNSSYYGWPIMWDPVSMDNMLGMFTAGNDWDRYPYPIFASYGESSWYSDTTYTGSLQNTPLLIDVDGNRTDWPNTSLVASDPAGDMSAAYDLTGLYFGSGKDASTGTLGWFVGLNTTVSSGDNTTYVVYLDTAGLSEASDDNITEGNFSTLNVVPGSVTVYLNGTEWTMEGNYTLDTTNGTITYINPLYDGSIVTADYSYISGATFDAEGYSVNANTSSMPEYALYFRHNASNGNFTTVIYEWNGRSWDTSVNISDIGGCYAYNSSNEFIEAFLPRDDKIDLPSISLEAFSTGADPGNHAQDTVPPDGNVTFASPDWSTVTTTLNNFTTVASSFLAYSQGHEGYWTKRYDPNGYGNGNFDRISRNYYVGNITSASGNYHLGIAKDDHLTAYAGERVGMLVVDSSTPGVYDTVYVDLNNNLDFTDEKPVNKSSPLCYEDINGDGEPDISGGLLYYISNTQGRVTDEIVMNNTAEVRDSATLAYGHIVTDVGAGYSLESTLILNLNDSGNISYLPFYSEPIYQDIVLDGTGVKTNTTFFLNDTSVGFSTYNPVNFTYLNSIGFGISGGTLELYYGNDTDEYDMTESTTPGFLNYTFDPATGNITLLFNMENGSYIYALYQMDTYSLDFTTGDISFMSDIPAGMNVTADYDYGLSLPYSDTYAARMGYDNFIPASGDVVAFFGDFDAGQDHGTLCASSIAGTWTSWTSGTAPSAKIIGVGDFYMTGGYDSWYFAVEGYDGIPDTGDEAQIVSNSFGSPGENADGWNYGSRLAYDITTNYAPNSTFVVAAGNDGWGYGTVTSPGSAPGVITAGAGVNMAYRWLFGYDGGQPGDDSNYFAPDTSWYGDIADFSGRGPTALGTPDPDVLAVGEFAIGSLPLNEWAVTARDDYGLPADGNDAWDLWSGTSLATPVTAGVLALVYQSYYVNHNNTWPSGDAAKKILTSSCDDHGYDPLQQGAGWLNASLAVQMAAEMNGVTSDTMYWTPGDYHGQKLDASVHLIDPGASDSTEISFTNHNSSSPATVALSDAFYNKTDEYTFNITTNTYDVRIIKPDGVYLADGTQVLSAAMTTEWNNADFMKVTAYTTQTDVAYPYMELSDWMDDRPYSDNETAFNSEIISVDNETVIVGHNGETYAYIPNLPFLSGKSISVYSNGTFLDNSTGGNYTLNVTTGKIIFLNDTGATRALQDGEVITATYTYYLPVEVNDSYVLARSPVDSHTVWLTNVSGNVTDWTSSEGTNFTFDATTGNITLNTTLQPGDQVTVDYSCSQSSIYGGNETAFDSKITTVENETIISGQYGETYAFFNSSNLVPGEPIYVYSNGTLLDNSTGGNYTLNATTGKISFLNDTGSTRSLWDGEVINVTYTHYLLIRVNDSYVLANSPVTSYTVWLTDLSGNTINWTSSEGTNFTFDASTGTITLNTTLQPGDQVDVEYFWSHKGIYDGATERIRMNVNLRQANLVSAGIYDPASRIDSGLLWSMKDVNVMYLGAPPVNISFKVTVEFYQKADWSWLSTNMTTLTIPAGETANITANISVPADAPVGAYEGSIVYVVNDHTSIIPVLVNVPATTFPVHFGGNVPTTSLYENGAGMGGYGGGASGDWRFYFVDVDNLKVEDARKLLMMEYWNHPADDWEMYLFGAESDPYGFSGGQYGDFRMVQFAGTKEAVGLTDTLVPGSEILSTDMMNGPFEVAIRGMSVSGESMLSEVHGDMGYMSVSPNNLDIYTSDTSGSVPVTVYSDIDLYRGIGSAVTYSKTSAWDAQPVDPYAYPGGSFEAYLAASSNEVVLTIPEQTVSATFTLHFYNGANDVDMGIFYDANGDGVAEADEIIVPSSQTATAANPEVGSLMFPPAGTYIVKAAGYDVAPGSLFDLTVETLGIGESAFSAVNAANTTIPAGTPSTFGVGWDFGDTAPTDAATTLMLVSPGAAPYALVVPIDITLHYDANAPVINSPTPESGAVIQSASLISANFEDSSPIDTKLSTMSIDGRDVSSQVQFTDTMVIYNARGLADGVHTVNVKLVDKVGNIGTYSWGFTVDSTAPYLSVDVPPVTSADTVSITGVTESTATLAINGNSVDVSSDGTFTYDIAITSGQTLVDVIATDLAGNTAEITRTIVMDDTAPGLTVVLPLTVSSSDTVISGTVTGLDSEVGPVSVTINGVPVTVNSDGTFALPVTLLEGSNEFTIVVTDAAGNPYTLQKSIILDSTAPTLSVMVPSTSASTSLSISGSTTGASKLLVNGKQVLLGSDGSFTATVSLSPGSNTIVITAMDAMGNSVERTYSVTHTPADLIPAMSASAPAQSAPALTAGGGVLAVVLFIIGLIIGFLAKMFMGGGGTRPEEEEMAPQETEEEGELVGTMGGMPMESIPGEATEEPFASVEEGGEVPVEEVPPVEEETVTETPETPIEEPESESSEPAAETPAEEDEDKGEVIDLSDI